MVYGDRKDSKIVRLCSLNFAYTFLLLVYLRLKAINGEAMIFMAYVKF